MTYFYSWLFVLLCICLISHLAVRARLVRLDDYVFDCSEWGLTNRGSGQRVHMKRFKSLGATEKVKRWRFANRLFCCDGWQLIRDVKCVNRLQRNAEPDYLLSQSP